MNGLRRLNVPCNVGLGQWTADLIMHQRPHLQTRHKSIFIKINGSEQKLLYMYILLTKCEGCTGRTLALGLFCRTNNAATLIWTRLLFWHGICIVQFKKTNLAHSLPLTYTIMTWIFRRKRFRVNTHFQTASILTWFWSHETVSMWNCIHVNAA